MSGKITHIQQYYKGRSDTFDIEITDNGEMVSITGYDGIETIEKNKLRIVINGSFIIDSYDVDFSDNTNHYKTVGIPLAVGISGYNKARAYANKATKAIGEKYLENVLLLSISRIDRPYFID